MTQLATRITKRVADAAQAESKDYIIWDDELPGFGLRIYATGKKSYVIQYRHSGRSRRLTLGLHGPLTPDEARRQAKAHLGKVATGGDPAEERAGVLRDPTVHELCDLYLKEGPILKPHKKASTWKTERSAVARHIRPLLGRRKLASLTKMDIQQFQADVTVGKTATVEKTGFRGKAVVRGGYGIGGRVTAMLAAILSFAVERGLRADNPARGIQLNKVRKLDRFLSGEELTRLGAVLRDEARKDLSRLSVAAIMLLLFTGCRKSEILTLRWRYIDWDNGLLRLPDSKTGAKIVPLGKPALDLLRSLPVIENDPFVFPSPREGKHLVGLQKVWARVRKAAGLWDVRLHDLRHSFASMAVAGGSSLYMVGKVLGHKDSRTTEIYAHIGSDPLKTVANETATKLAGLLGPAVAHLGSSESEPVEMVQAAE
jgi:integrase